MSQRLVLYKYAARDINQNFKTKRMIEKLKSNRPFSLSPKKLVYLGSQKTKYLKDGTLVKY